MLAPVTEGRRIWDSGSMSSASDILDRDSWAGGYYELSVELGERHDARLQVALDTLWEAAAIEGPYAVEWSPRPRSWPIPRTVTSLDAGLLLRGRVALPDGRPCVCCVVAIREQASGVDWLDFCLPTVALGALDTRLGGFPFGDDGGPASLVWRWPLDDWLAGLGRAIYAAVPFRLALVGFETGGSNFLSKIAALPPEERYFGYLLPDGPTYYPANR